MIKTIGQAAIFGYFGLFYFLPTVLMAFYGPHVNFVNNGNAFLCAIISFMVFIFAFSFIYRTRIRIPTKWASPIPNFYENTWFILGVALVTFPIALNFRASYGSGFRYSGEELSASGFVPQYIVFYKALYYAYVFYWFLRILSGAKLSLSSRVGLVLHSVNWCLCANGAADVMWVGVAASIGIGTIRARRLFVVSMAERQATRGVLRKIFILFIFVFCILGVIFFGYVNKVGMDGAISLFTLSNANMIGYYLYYRLSVFVSSMEHLLSYGLDFDLYSRALNVLWDMVSYRFGVVLGVDVGRPEVTGLNHLNYYEIFSDPMRDRAGASPGVIGSFLYLPMLPFNLLFAAVYVGAVANSYTRSAPLGVGERPTIFAILFVTIASYSLFHNPIEAFIKIGPDVAKTFLILVALEKAYRKAKMEPMIAGTASMVASGGAQYQIRSLSR